MRHIKTFESFINESGIWGDMTDAILLKGTRDSIRFFFQQVRNNDSFKYTPNGEQLEYLKDPKMLKQKDVELDAEWTEKGGPQLKCTVIKRGKGISLGTKYNNQKYDVIYFTVENDPRIFVLPSVY